jgi:hypothetical protein
MDGFTYRGTLVLCPVMLPADGVFALAPGCQNEAEDFSRGWPARLLYYSDRRTSTTEVEHRQPKLTVAQFLHDNTMINRPTVV